MHMGRRPLGRKYAKHISIQVKEAHNDDLKYLAEKLSNNSPLPNGKRWTIRDIVLTLLYTQYSNSPDWFTKNHFEQYSETDLSKIRDSIRTIREGRKKSEITISSKSNIDLRKTAEIKEVPTKKLRLEQKLNSDYQNYYNKIRTFNSKEDRKE